MLKETHNLSKIGLENWNFGLKKKYSSEMSDCFSKGEYFQKAQKAYFQKVIGSSQWQVSVISIF